MWRSPCRRMPGTRSASGDQRARRKTCAHRRALRSLIPVYRWIAWSDGGGETHGISTLSEGGIYTATFGCDVLVPVEGLVSTPLGGGAMHLNDAFGG